MTTREPLVLVPRSKAPRRSKGAVRAWYLAGMPRAEVFRDRTGRIDLLTLDLPIDVPSKPRATQGSTWGPSWKNYAAWRYVFIGGIDQALAEQGCPFDIDPIRRLPKQTTFARPEFIARRGVTEKVEPIGHLSVDILVFTELRGDVDNRAKSFLDACNRWLWYDDTEVTHIGVDLYRCPKGQSRVQATIQSSRPGDMIGDFSSRYDLLTAAATEGRIGSDSQRKGRDSGRSPLDERSEA